MIFKTILLTQLINLKNYIIFKKYSKKHHFIYKCKTNNFYLHHFSLSITCLAEPKKPNKVKTKLVISLFLSSVVFLFD